LDFFCTGFKAALNASINVGGFGGGLFDFGSFFLIVSSGLTKKAEPPPTRDVNRDSGTDSANGGWLLVI
jgi:hypothetical protein